MKNEAYKTQNLFEAAFLIARGFDLAGKIDGGTKMTILIGPGDKAEIEALRFYNGAKVEAKKFSDAYRTLKDYVFMR